MNISHIPIKKQKHLITLEICIFAMLISFVSCRQSSDAIVTQDWEISRNPSQSIESVTVNNAWTPIQLPSLFNHGYLPINDYQFVWLRGSCSIPDSPELYAGISLGRVYYLETVYINGRVIGTREKDDPMSFHYPRNYEIPEKVLKAGKNSIYIRLGIYGRQSGCITSLPAIYKEQEFRSQREMDEFLYHYLPLGAAVFIVLQIFTSLILFFMTKRDEVHVYCALYSLFCFVNLMIYFMNNNPLSFNLRLAITYSSAIGIMFLGLMLIQSIYKVYLWKFNRMILIYAVIALFLSFYTIDSVSDHYYAKIISDFTIILNLPLFVYTLLWINKIKPDRTKFFSIIAVSLIPALAILWEIIRYFTHTLTSPTATLFVLIWPIVMFGFSIIAVEDFLTTRIGYLNVIRDLLGPSADEGLNDENSFDAAIKCVIRFLDKHYAMNIAPDSLASLLNLNTSELDKGIKNKTGSGFYEYVNSLRINQAKIILRDTDITMDEIVFSLGFTGRKAFEKAFKKNTGHEPAEFRERKDQ